MEAVAAAAPSDRPRIARLQTGAVGAAESSERGGVNSSNIPQGSQGQKASVYIYRKSIDCMVYY